MANVKSTVEKILSLHPGARDSDKMLFLTFMALHGVHLDIDSANAFLKMPSLESARRERQKFQEKGLYPASKKVKANRSRMEQEIGQRIPTTKPQNTGKLFAYENKYGQEYMGDPPFKPTLFDIPVKRND